MSTRLDKQKQASLQPERMQFAKEQIEGLGYKITHQSETELNFDFKGKKVYFFPYSGWHSGSSIIDGRGIKKLLKQIQT